MLKNILAVIGAVTIAAVTYVAFSDHVIVKIEPDEESPEDPKEPEEPAKPSEPKKEDHKLTFDELVRKMDESEERLAEAEAAAAAAKDDDNDEDDEDDEPKSKVEEVKIQDDSTETE